MQHPQPPPIPCRALPAIGSPPGSTYDPGTGLLQIGAGPSEWLLQAVAPEKLAAALEGRGPTEVQFNPELLVLLLPGAFTAAGTSFFRLRG